MWPLAYTVRPQAYMRTVLPSEGANGSSVRVKVLYRRIVGLSILRERPRRLPFAAVGRDSDHKLTPFNAELHVPRPGAAGAPRNGVGESTDGFTSNCGVVPEMAEDRRADLLEHCLGRSLIVGVECED